MTRRIPPPSTTPDSALLGNQPKPRASAMSLSGSRPPTVLLPASASPLVSPPLKKASTPMSPLSQKDEHRLEKVEEWLRELQIQHAQLQVILQKLTDLVDRHEQQIDQVADRQQKQESRLETVLLRSGWVQWLFVSGGTLALNYLFQHVLK